MNGEPKRLWSEGIKYVSNMKNERGRNYARGNERTRDLWCKSVSVLGEILILSVTLENSISEHNSIFCKTLSFPLREQRTGVMVDRWATGL